VDTHQPVPDGEKGNMVVTCLYKDDVYPVIRFNTCDVSEFVVGDNDYNLPFKRIRGFLGRSDNMVKLRGINIYPTGVGAMLMDHPEFGGEYICRADRDETGRDEMTVIAEVSTPEAEREALLAPFGETLRRKIGIAVNLELVGLGETANLTELNKRQKPLRLIDKR
jgi:phenylacetate-CoA ligase